MGRSDLAWKKIFIDAGLKLQKEQIQRGLPDGLYEVKMFVYSFESQVDLTKLPVGTLCVET